MTIRARNVVNAIVAGIVILLDAIFLLVAAPGTATAHPGIGIVADSKGAISYTDLSRVWRISPDGEKSLAVSDVIPSRTGFRDDYDDFHFVRDRAGNMYWTDDDSVTVLRKMTPGGKVTEISRSRIRRAGWMTISRSGTVFTVEGTDLIATAAGGGVRTVARGVTTDGEGRQPSDGRRSVMGLWTDGEDNVYLAIPEGKFVRRVDPKGNASIADRSVSPWVPSGGLVEANGDLWVLEFSTTNAVRVRHVQRNGVTRIF